MSGPLYDPDDAVRVVFAREERAVYAPPARRPTRWQKLAADGVLALLATVGASVLGGFAIVAVFVVAGALGLVGP